MKKVRNLECDKPFVIDPYGVVFKVVLTDDVKKSLEGLDMDTSDLHASTIAATAWPDNDPLLTLIVLPFYASAGTIAHEAWHAVSHMLLKVGAKLDDEVVAYHLDFVVRFITEYVKDTQTKLKAKRKTDVKR